MILVDTSVWVDHFRRGIPALRDILIDSLVLSHPFVIGELACGNLSDRKEILGDLNALPMAVVAGNGEVFRLIEERKLWARGIGWVDVHLLASALLSTCMLWTLDKRLDRSAAAVGVKAYKKSA